MTIFSATVGTSVFSTLSLSGDQRILIVVWVISVAASVLSGISTFFNYPQLSIKHHHAGADYGRLRRRID